MTSRSRLLARLIDATGDVRADALDNVSVADVDEVVQSTANSTSASAFVIDSIDANTIRATTFQVVAFSNTDYQYTTVSAVLNSLNNDCEYTEYGTMESSELATYSIRVLDGNMELIADPIQSGITFKISRISIDN